MLTAIGHGRPASRAKAAFNQADAPLQGADPPCTTGRLVGSGGSGEELSLRANVRPDANARMTSDALDFNTWLYVADHALFTG